MQSVYTDEESIDLRFYWRQLRRHPWLMPIIVLLCLILAGIYLAITRPMYRSTATLLIEKKKSNVVPFDRVSEPDESALTFFDTQSHILKSRSLARRVIDKLGLRTHPEFASFYVDSVELGIGSAARSWMNTLAQVLRDVLSLTKTSANQPPETSLSPSQSKPDSQAAAASDLKRNTNLVDAFLDRLQISSNFDTEMIRVGFDSYDPALARDITHNLVQLYIDFNAETRFASLQDTLDWLKNQGLEMSQQVEKSEQVLQKYKDEHGVILIDERLPALMRELTALDASIAEVKAERIELGTLYQKTRDTMAKDGDMGWLPAVMENELIQNLKIQHIQAQHEYAQLQQRYGVEHPRAGQVKLQLEEIKSKVDREINQVVESIRVKYQLIQERERGLHNRVEDLKKETKILNEKAVQHNILKRDTESNHRLADVLLNRLKETSISADLASASIRVLDTAEVPTKPFNVRPALTLGLASVIGLVLGGGLIACLGFFDKTVRTPNEAEEFLGFPVVGTIEKFHQKSNQKLVHPPLITIESPHSKSAAAFKAIRTNLLFGHVDPPPKVFLVTSAHPYDGKSTIAANLAVVTAEADRRVLLVDTDLRHPSAHRFFETCSQTGLSELLLTENYKSLADHNDVGVTVVPVGDSPPNPSELLSSKRVERFLEFARHHYDTVIIDTPCIFAVSDAVVLSPLVDSILLVLRASVTRYDHAKRAIDTLMRIQTNPLSNSSEDTAGNSSNIGLGLILNFLDPQDSVLYGYHGYQNYYHER